MFSLRLFAYLNFSSDLIFMKDSNLCSKLSWRKCAAIYVLFIKRMQKNESNKTLLCKHTQTNQFISIVLLENNNKRAQSNQTHCQIIDFILSESLSKHRHDQKNKGPQSKHKQTINTTHQRVAKFANKTESYKPSITRL
jgi:hypothetical protein